MGIATLENLELSLKLRNLHGEILACEVKVHEEHVNFLRREVDFGDAQQLFELVFGKSLQVLFSNRGFNHLSDVLSFVTGANEV